MFYLRESLNDQLNFTWGLVSISRHDDDDDDDDKKKKEAFSSLAPFFIYT